ncbi:hypothetical protein LP420_31840 [Massilia sp. B-10]|nr:hypothetical protein LP420_31840 [Massilia sp. B-10]UUZ53333.1 hypothetical protein LP419_31365 [Massilia sp. H-1]
MRRFDEGVQQHAAQLNQQQDRGGVARGAPKQSKRIHRRVMGLANNIDDLSFGVADRRLLDAPEYILERGSL